MMRAPLSAAITASATLPYTRSPAARSVSVPSIDLRDSPTSTDGPAVLVGLSRKSMLGTLTERAAGERVYGSVALAVIAALNGARIIRAHDVAATVEALKVTAAVQGPVRR